jgi:hypothetical protein
MVISYKQVRTDGRIFAIVDATPEGALTAPVGSFVFVYGSVAGQHFYYKASGSGNTGWLSNELPNVGPGAGTIGSSSSIVRSTTLDVQGRVTAATATDLGALTTGLVKVTNSTGALTTAVSGTDYELPLTFSNGLTRTTNTVKNDLNTGIAGGQTALGGINSGDNLTLKSTSHATAGVVQVDSASNFLLGGAANVASTILGIAVDKTVASSASARWDGIDVKASTLTLSGVTNVTSGVVSPFVVRGPTISTTVTLTNVATMSILAEPSVTGGGSATNRYTLHLGAATTGQVLLLGTGSEDVVVTAWTGGFRQSMITSGNTGAANTVTLANSKVSIEGSTGNITMVNGSTLTAGTGTGLKIGSSTTTKLGAFGVTPVVQPTRGATLTNNVTAGGTDDTIANYTDLTIYANDAAAIRNNLYQLARIQRQHDVGLRALGWLS